MPSSNRRAGVIIALSALGLPLGGCKTAYDYEREAEISRKRDYLSSLRTQIQSLDDQIIRQRAMLRVEMTRLDNAANNNRLSQAAYSAAKNQLREDQRRLKILRVKLDSTRSEFSDLAKQSLEDRAARNRRKDLAVQISQLRRQIEVLEKVMKQRAEMRVKRYNQ